MKRKRKRYMDPLHIRKKKPVKHTLLHHLGFNKTDVVGILKDSINSMGTTFKKRKKQLGL